MFTIRKARPYIEMLRSQLGEPTRAAEVGVWQGSMSRQLLRSFPELELLMVDRYCKYNKASHDARLSKMTQLEFDGALSYAVSSTSKHAARRIVMVGDSLKVCQEIKLESLDFVFIDADHSYEAVKKDIPNWKKTVRKGGIVSGHDYSPRHRGVCQAVDEFCAEHGYSLNHLPQCIWWVKND